MASNCSKCQFGAQNNNFVLKWEGGVIQYDKETGKRFIRKKDSNGKMKKHYLPKNARGTKVYKNHFGG